MGYTTEELFGNVKPGSAQDYALRQKFAECVDCGWVEKHEMTGEDEIVCQDCWDKAFDRID